MMKKSHLLLSILLGILTICSCTPNQQSNNPAPGTSQVNGGVKDISAEAALNIFNKQDTRTVFLDVRTPEEVAEGKIDGALTINLRDDDFKNQLLELDKSNSYLVYCKSGGRSSRASKMMVDNGFKDVSNVEGGYSAWSKLTRD